ncbi:MAG: endonuclease [Pseudomonadota bacterium]
MNPFRLQALTAPSLLMVFLACDVGAACTKPVVPAYIAGDYYAPASGLAGAALKNALHDIIDGHIVQTYSCTWDMLKEADADPANPANVIGLYSRRSIPKTDQDTGGNTPDAWNREHVWANSHGFPNSGYHAYTDGHHLFAADKSINADRANDDFAYGGVPNPECTACKEDAALETWEAPDLVKGDIARVMMYMAVRYAGGSGVDGGTPDLELVDRLTDSGEPRFGDLCDLVAWHQGDPVSNAERSRNDTIYSWQGNRNPFVDHPEYVLQIFGDPCGIQAPVETGDGDVPLPLWVPFILGGGLLLGAMGRWRLKPGTPGS